MLAASIAELEATGGVAWGVSLSLNGEILDGAGADRELATASVGKVLLLAAIAEAIEGGSLAADELVERAADDAVADSGIWQHMEAEALSVHDLCVLIGSVSDNLATNALLRRIGSDRVDASGSRLGLERTGLRDKVRDVRGPGDPPHLSTGSAAELRRLFELLREGRLLTPQVSDRVRGWLAANTDLSMVAAALCLDPLAHNAPDRGLTLVNKTGTNAGVRADAGYIVGPAGTAAYAVIANWGEADERDAVLAAMRRFGMTLRNAVGEA